MDIFINILIFLHLFALVMGMGSGMALSRVGPMLAGAGSERRDTLFELGGKLGKMAHAGLGLLWITGPLIVWLKYGGLDGFDIWFWVKMVLVVILSASIGMGSAAFRKLRAGDASAAPRVKTAGTINGLCGIAIIFCAVFAFG